MQNADIRTCSIYRQFRKSSSNKGSLKDPIQIVGWIGNIGGLGCVQNLQEK